MKNNKFLAISVILMLILSAAGLIYTNVNARPMGAATAPGLGAASGYSVLAGQSANSYNMTTIGGSLGVSPGNTNTGDWLVGGSTNLANGDAANAQNDALGAYNNLASQASDGTWSLVPNPPPGVWTTASSAIFSDNLVLTGGPTDVWVFQVGASLTFSGSVTMAGGAQACNVFWQVGESTTIASGSSFIGTVITENDTTIVSGANVSGRVFSLVGALTTDNNTISMPPCNSGDSVVSGPPDNPQPESGSTEAYVGTQTALTATSVASRAGVPSTGGAPLQGGGSTFLLIGIIGLTMVALFFAFRKLRQIFGS